MYKVFTYFDINLYKYFISIYLFILLLSGIYLSLTTLVNCYVWKILFYFFYMSPYVYFSIYLFISILLLKCYLNGLMFMYLSFLSVSIYLCILLVYCYVESLKGTILVFYEYLSFYLHSSVSIYFFLHICHLLFKFENNILDILLHSFLYSYIFFFSLCVYFSSYIVMYV